MMNSTHNPNRSLISIFCLSLGGLLSVYTAIAVYGLFQPENISTAELAMGGLRILLRLVRRAAGQPDQADGRELRNRLREYEQEKEDQTDRAGDHAQPVAGTGDDPLAGLGLPRLFLL